MAVQKFIDYIAERPSLIFIGLAGYTAVYLVSRLLARPKPGRNPFSSDTRRPREKLLINQQDRDAILKQRFKPSKVPENLDVIVVGSGAGGLVTAQLLARAGKRVLVLEQHDQAGGCCHTFIEKGFEFDTGIHYIGNMTAESRSCMLLDQLTDGQLDWVQMDDEFDVVAIGESAKPRLFPMKSGQEQYRNNLIKMFPKEEAAISKYLDLVSKADKSFDGIIILKFIPKRLAMFLIHTGLYRLLFSCFKYTSRTLQEVLDELTDDQDLKAVLSYICGDYGVYPKDVPFILHSLLTRHYWGGAYYPHGGPSEIILQMIRIIERHGGKVLVQAPVSKILCNEKGSAVGVRVARKSGDVDLPAKMVVSDASVVTTFKTLLPQEIAKKSCIYPLIDIVGTSMSYLTTFVGVDGSQKELQLPSGNTWYYRSNDINKTLNDYLSLDVEDIASAPVPFCYISFPSAKDPSYQEKHPGKTALQIITLARWDWFESWKDGRLKHRGEDYEDLKNRIGDQMWKTCCELFPQLDGKKEYLEVGTPVTNQYYLAQPSGEMYGLYQGKSRFTPEVIASFRAETDIPSLYLTGQDMMLCGFTSVLYGGVITASSILHRNLLTDFGTLRASILKQEGSKKEK